jgi:hypothetical protein
MRVELLYHLNTLLMKHNAGREVADLDIKKAQAIVERMIKEDMKAREKMPADEADRKYAEEFIAKYLAHEGPFKTVTEFIQENTLGNEDNFYTPTEEMFETHEEAVNSYNGKWNLPEDENPTSKAPHPNMMGYLELPYGTICNSCGGSMVAVIQLDRTGAVLKTLLENCR